MRSVRALAVVLPLVLMTGCGVAGTQFHPGVAAEVGDQTITTKHIDDVVNHFCAAVEQIAEEGDQPGEATPLGTYARQFAGLLANEAAAEQLAAEYDVEAGDEYKSRLAQLEPQLSGLSSAQQEAVREVVGAGAYTSDVLAQIGQQILEEEGTSDADVEAQFTAGLDRLNEWAADHDVEINPRYSASFGSEEPLDTSLSYAAGETAKDGLLPEPPVGYTGSLPGHAVCLD